MRELRGTADFTKELAPTYGFSRQMKGFTLYEVENEQQIINHYLYYPPLMKFKWAPFMESTDFIATYMKKKK